MPIPGPRVWAAWFTPPRGGSGAHLPWLQVRSKREEKVMPRVTSRTIKKEFKSSQKNKTKEGRLPQGAAPVPFETGEAFKQPTTILPALPDFGGRTFGCSADTAGQNEAFWNRYGQYVHQPSIALDGRVLPRFTAQAIRRVAKEGVTKAGGPDGLTPQMIVWLPDEPLSRLADILNLCERQNRCPSDLSHWKVAVIPKKRKGKLASVGDVRPAAVGALVYRLWARLQLQAVRDVLSTCLLKTQGGGVRGQDAETLVMSCIWTIPKMLGNTGSCLTLVRLLTAWIRASVFLFFVAFTCLRPLFRSLSISGSIILGGSHSVGPFVAPRLVGVRAFHKVVLRPLWL